MNKISTAAERQVLVETDNIISAIISLMFLYYDCNFKYQYSKKCYNVFTTENKIFDIYLY